MSEDVKPRKSIGRNIVDEWDLKHFKRVPVVSSGFQYTIREDLIKMVDDKLEPTMRLIDELADILETSAKRNISPRFYAREVLEKYKKFKEGLKL